MQAKPTALDGVIELHPVRHGDDRGWFAEVWNQQTLADLGITIEWIQDNEAWSASAATLRGFHYQLPPKAQDKLVRASTGRVLDVVIDLRRSSPTFGQHVGVELSAEQGNLLLVPKGFGHGYCTLEPNSVIAYKVSDYYSPKHDRAIRWNDPELAVEWPFTESELTLSAKDAGAPLLADADELFD